MDEFVDFYTSGSTGMPKTVRRTAASLRADATMLAQVFRPLFAAPGTVFLSTVSPKHMYGRLWTDLLPQMLGAACHPETITGWESLSEAQQRYGSVVFVTTPSFLSELTAQRDAFVPTHNFAAVVTSGSLLRPELSAAVTELFGVCPLEIYGSTETGSVAWRRQSEGSAWTLFDAVRAEPTSEGALSVVSPFAVTSPYVLQDAVTFADARRFSLHGRLDRQAKILEHRVVLSDIEACFRRHPAVEDCAAVASDGDAVRLWLTVVPGEAGRGLLFRDGYAGLTRTLRAFAAKGLPGYCIPRRMRFVRALPYTAQGKLPRAALLAPFAVRRQEPAVTSWEVREDTLRADFFFPSDALFFQGHFPGFPILPGVAQLFTVRSMVRAAFGTAPDGTVRRLKFQRPITPLLSVTLEADRLPDGAVDFRLTCAEGPCASGRLTPAAVSAEGGAHGV